MFSEVEFNQVWFICFLNALQYKSLLNFSHFWHDRYTIVYTYNIVQKLMFNKNVYTCTL